MPCCFRRNNPEMKRLDTRIYVALGVASVVAVAITAAVLWQDGGPTRNSSFPAKSGRPVISGDKPLIGEPADSSLIYEILNPSSPADHSQLVGRIDSLSESLTESESMAICRALHEGLQHFVSLTVGQRHHVANQLMDTLLRQHSQGAWLASELTGIWRDDKVDETMRDYALQHLAQLIEGRGPASRHLLAWRAEGIPILLAAARATTKRSAGTAILALHFLIAGNRQAGEQSGFVQDFDSMLDSVATDNTAHPSARASAFQVAAARARANLLDTARTLAGDKTTPPSVRLGVIHYLSTCGHNADAALMGKIEEENDLRYLAASRTARARLLSMRP